MSQESVILVIPYSSLAYNDARFVNTQGYSSGFDFFDSCRRALDEYRREGEKGFPSMMSVGLHARWIGHAGRASALEFIEYELATGDVWFARRIDIAEWWQPITSRSRWARSTSAEWSRVLRCMKSPEVDVIAGEFQDVGERRRVLRRSCRLVIVGKHEVGVYRLGEKLHAVRNWCPHRGAPICRGELRGAVVCRRHPGTFVPGMAGEVLHCPWHQWEFNLVHRRLCSERTNVG